MNPGGRSSAVGTLPSKIDTNGQVRTSCGQWRETGTGRGEAPIVVRIFTMYADGNSLATIAKILNAEGVKAPQPPRNRQIRAWCPSSIREMLRNERYRGVFVWNRTKKERNPETAGRPADLALSRTGCGWRFPNGGSYPTSFGSGQKHRSSG